MRLRIYLVVIQTLLIFSNAFCQNLRLSDNVDTAYLQVVRSANSYNYISLNGSSIGENEDKSLRETILRNELFWRRYRKLGIEFWNMFPNDIRRFEWFEMTTSLSRQVVNYWKYPQIAVDQYLQKESYLSSYKADLDLSLLKKWHELYPKFRKEYIDYVLKMKLYDKLYTLFASELDGLFKLSRNSEYRTNCFFSSAIIKDAVVEKLEYIDRYGNSAVANKLIRSINYPLFSGFRFLGFNPDTVFHLLSELAKEDVVRNSIPAWIQQSTNLINLIGSKMDLEFSSPEGELFNLEKWRPRNSVVLVDIWALSCSSCIGRMKYLKQVYDKYNHRGFRVLSICVGGSEDRKKVDSILSSINANWRSLLAGRLQRDRSTFPATLWDKYGFNFVPHMFLLDKNGHVAMYNHELVSGNIEPFLNQLIDN